MYLDALIQSSCSMHVIHVLFFPANNIQEHQFSDAQHTITQGMQPVFMKSFRAQDAHNRLL